MCLVKRLVRCLYHTKHYIIAKRISGLAKITPLKFNTTDISGLANKWKKMEIIIQDIVSEVSDNKQKRTVLIHMGGHQLHNFCPDPAGHCGG